MTQPVEISFVETADADAAAHQGRVALIVTPGGKLPPGLPRPARDAAMRALDSKAGKALKPGGSLELAFPAGMAADALHLIALPPKATAQEARKAGAAIGAKLGKVHTLVLAGGHAQAADIALGIALRGYDFSVYQTKPDGDDTASGDVNPAQLITTPGAHDDARMAEGEGTAPAEPGDANPPQPEKARVTFAAKDPEALARAARDGAALAEGVFFTRDLVNEPANVLTTSDFADRLQAMEEIGLTVEVLDEDELAKLGMRALLAVGQGSESPSKVVVMRWNGGGDEPPLALVGKGVVFDTGGISIKPAAGMEEMTMDMGGAGVVAGVMRTLALRRARANVVGLVGLVENMPDGRAQRPGDIVRSMKGDTIEVINTDAEG
ncbi:MAG: leucyl aminopeptidase, partial [Paracoccus sp. (in: a-proteobacteria)]|nr:leucyl aminopeptidase [Paracoccus sp. (in: a-proteobacteria)]